jgi:predicted homoserine dehydrogenase-like protein
MAGTALATSLVPSVLKAGSGEPIYLEAPKREKKIYSPNDQVNVAVIGMGIMGFNNTESTLLVPGVKLVGACDLYTGRLDRAKEVMVKIFL